MSLISLINDHPFPRMVVSVTLSGAIAYAQIKGHGEDHSHEEPGAPEPQNVVIGIVSAVTTTSQDFESDGLWPTIARSRNSGLRFV